jgi:hypothetical protein
MKTLADRSGGTTSIERITPRRTKVGLVSDGLGAYWPQYPDLLPQLQASSRRVAERPHALDRDLVDAEGGPQAAELLRVAGCDLIVAFLLGARVDDSLELRGEARVIGLVQPGLARSGWTPPSRRARRRACHPHR